MQVQTVKSGEMKREFDFSDKEFRFLSELALTKTGIVLTEQKRSLVYGRLARRLRALKLKDFSQYCQLLQEDPDGEEMVHMVNALTTNLTGFFREDYHFVHLGEVLAELAKTKRDKRLRIWSSACSSGMEPYSIAMTMLNAIPDLVRWDARVLATDIDYNMLEIGRQGIYTEKDVEKLPQACRKYITKGPEKDQICIRDEVKQLVTFKHLNLQESWPMKGPFDAIFCRNVVIYFDKETKKRLFARMADLVPGGCHLYIGHSENLHGISNDFELVARTTYQRK